jgi:hypothetical protein
MESTNLKFFIAIFFLELAFAISQGLRRKELLIVVVLADPKPRYRIVIENAYRTVVSRDSHRPNVLGMIDALELQGRMKWIFRPQPMLFWPAVG